MLLIPYAGTRYSAVKELAPTIFPYVLSCYSAPSSLFWEDYVIESREGVQQGDPLGPLLFCLAIHEIIQRMIGCLK